MTVFNSVALRVDIAHEVRRCARVLLLAASVALIAPTTWAQPVSVAPSAAAIKKEIEGFYTRFLPLSDTDPTAALRLATDYLANSPLPAPERIDLYLRVSDQFNLNKTTTPAEQRPAFIEALANFADEGVAVIATQADSPQRTDTLLRLRELSFNVLLNNKGWAAAQKQLEAAWPLVLPNQNMDVWLERGKNLYLAQNQPEKIAPMLIQTVQGRLVARRRLDLALCLQVSRQLTAQKQNEQSLQWAKLAFVGCNVDERWVGMTTTALAEAWMAGGAPEKAEQFLSAQTHAGAPNPLDAVALPALDKRATEAALSTEGDASPPEDRMTVLMGLGRWSEALTLARLAGINDPRSQWSAMQVARVFKGHDDSLVRANQYLAYAQSGQGENPLPALIIEVAKP